MANKINEQVFYDVFVRRLRERLKDGNENIVISRLIDEPETIDGISLGERSYEFEVDHAGLWLYNFHLSSTEDHVQVILMNDESNASWDPDVSFDITVQNAGRQSARNLADSFIALLGNLRTQFDPPNVR